MLKSRYMRQRQFIHVMLRIDEQGVTDLLQQLMPHHKSACHKSALYYSSRLRSIHSGRTKGSVFMLILKKERVMK